jgi:hypothetical protein
MTGYSVTLILGSWALGTWRKYHKTILAVGPLRFTKHRDLPGWKEEA